MKPAEDRPTQRTDRVVIHLTAPKPAPAGPRVVLWNVVDIAVAALVLVALGWLLVPVGVVLALTGRYRRIDTSHPVLGNGRLGWVGARPAPNACLRFPPLLVPFLGIDLGLGAVSLRPECRSGYTVRCDRPEVSRRVDIDLTAAEPAPRSTAAPKVLTPRPWNRSEATS